MLCSQPMVHSRKMDLKVKTLREIGKKVSTGHELVILFKISL